MTFFAVAAAANGLLRHLSALADVKIKSLFCVMRKRFSIRAIVSRKRRVWWRHGDDELGEWQTIEIG